MVNSGNPVNSTIRKRKRKGPQSFTCTYDGCHKSFNKKLYLECHIRVHTREQPFECTQCTPSRKFSDKSNLKRHVQATHLKVKRFGCTHCGKHFAQSSNLKAHMLIHSGQKRFPCETCDKRFSRRDHLSFHSSKCIEKTKKKLSGLEKKNQTKKAIQPTLSFPIQKNTRRSRKVKKIDSTEIASSNPISTTTIPTTITKIENMDQGTVASVDEKTIEYLKLYTNDDQVVPDSIFEEHGITVIEVTAVKIENDVDPLFDNNNNTPVTEENQNTNNNDNDNIVKVEVADQIVPLMPYLESMSPEDELFYQDVALNVTISQESEGVQQIREIYNNNNNNNNNTFQENSPFSPFRYLLSDLPALIPVTAQTLSQELNFSTRYSSFLSQNQTNGPSFTVFSPPTF